MEPRDRSRLPMSFDRNLSPRDPLASRPALTPRRPPVIAPLLAPVSAPAPVQTPISTPTPQSIPVQPTPTRPVMPANPVFQRPAVAPVTPLAPPSPAATKPAPPPRHHRHRLVLVVSGIILLVGLLAGSAIAVVGHISHQPNKVLLQALANSLTGQVKNQTFTGALNGPDYQATFDGVMGQAGQFRLTTTATIAGSNLKTDLRSVDGKNLYVYAAGLPQVLDNPQLTADSQAVVPGLFKLYDPILRQLNNQWYQATLPIQSLSSTDMTALAALYAQSPFLKIVNTYPDAVIAKSASVHYQIAIDGLALKNFMINLNNLHIANVLIPQDQLSLLNDSLATTNFQQHPIDVWISKDYKAIDQLAFNANGTSFKYTVTDFTTPVTVATPSPVKSSADLGQQLTNLDSSNALLNSNLGTGPNGSLAQLLMIALPQ